MKVLLFVPIVLELIALASFVGSVLFQVYVIISGITALDPMFAFGARWFFASAILFALLLIPAGLAFTAFAGLEK